MERIDRAENARRFYAMEVTEDRQLGLFAEVRTEARVLVLTWGRLGTRLQVKRERHEDPVRLGARWHALERKRKRHGYVVTRRCGGTLNVPSVSGTRTATVTAGPLVPTM